VEPMPLFGSFLLFFKKLQKGKKGRVEKGDVEE